MTSTRTRGWSAGILLTVALAGCGHATVDASPPEPPVQLSAVPGSDLKEVRLTEQSEARLGIATTPVATAPAGAPAGQLQVPYSAIVYDEQGGTWVWVTSAGHTFVRSKVTVDHVSGALALLSAGPAAGTPVVTTGSQELLGAEYEISGEG